MNEIEEYLLMIFLEEENLLDLYVKLHGNNALTTSEYDKLDLSADKWNDFKKEELGRTLPEEFEFFTSDAHLKCLRHDEVCIAFNRNKNEVHKNKIKITVVEDD
jgi:hypothetical protein